MNFKVPKSNYVLILEWLRGVLENIEFIREVKIFEADYFINNGVGLPAIAIQRGSLIDEPNPNEKCAGEENVRTSIDITLHVEPASKESIDPVLYYFEETIYLEIKRAVLHGNTPSCLGYFDFNNGRITNLYSRESHELFSNISKLTFDVGFSL